VDEAGLEEVVVAEAATAVVDLRMEAVVGAVDMEAATYLEVVAAVIVVEVVAGGKHIALTR